MKFRRKCLTAGVVVLASSVREGCALECGAASFSREIHADGLGQLLVRCEAQCNAWF